MAHPDATYKGLVELTPNILPKSRYTITIDVTGAGSGQILFMSLFLSFLPDSYNFLAQRLDIRTHGESVACISF